MTFNAKALEDAVNFAIADHNRRFRCEPVPEGQEVIWNQSVYVAEAPNYGTFFIDGEGNDDGRWVDDNFCGTAACIAGSINLSAGYCSSLDNSKVSLDARRAFLEQYGEDSPFYGIDRVGHSEVAEMHLGVDNGDAALLFQSDNNIWDVVYEAERLAEGYGATLSLDPIEGEPFYSYDHD